MGEVRRPEESRGTTLPPSSEHTGGAPAPSVSVDGHSVLQLYEQHVAAIYRFIYAKVGNREEAEDLTSQVFVKALHRIDSSRDPQSMQGWLFQVARTTVADHWREFYRLRSDSLDGLLSDGWEAAAAEATLPATQVDERVEQILSRLPNRYREVLTYRFLRNYSIKETAERMRISEANVKVLQFRALRRAAREDPGVL
jgi:RNA polymerase sigma-70 factor, ECF subfamily